MAVTAGPDFTDHYWAIIIGAIGALICTLGIKLLEIVKLDDVVGAIPAHLFAGIWGHACRQHRGRRRPGRAVRGRDSHRRLRVRDLVHRLAGAGVDAEGQVPADVERLGQDSAELGMESYPEFVLMPEEDDEE